MTEWPQMIVGSYPSPEIFAPGTILTRSELRHFVRIILTEGVPAVCEQFPLAFESAKEKAAKFLGVDAKQISLTGSARIGYSLAPEKFGRLFALSASDLDLFVVDFDLFSRSSIEFERFIELWDKGTIKPMHDMQAKYWQSAKEYDSRNIRSGFLNIDHIPTYDCFPVSKQAGQAVYLFYRELQERSGVSFSRKRSIRVYKSWPSAVQQISFSLRRALESRGVTVVGPG